MSDQPAVSALNVSMELRGESEALRAAIATLSDFLDDHKLAGEIMISGAIAVDERFAAPVVFPTFPVVNDTATGFDLETSLKEFLLEVPLRESSSLPSRSYQQLRRNRIDTVGQLIEQTKYDLLAITGLGQGCLGYVEERLGEVGLSLKPADY